MRPSLSILIAAVALASACTTDPSAATAAKDGGGGDGGVDGTQPSSDTVTVKNETLVVDGTTRTYVLAVPKARDAARALPLVLVFHGDGGDGPGMRTHHTFDAASGAEAIVAYPTGSKGDSAWDLYEPLATNKDMKFVEALVSTLATKQRVDPTRVFGVGYSSGAYLLNQLACRKNGFLRGMVVHAGGAPTEPLDPEAGVWPANHTRCKGQLAAPEGGVATLAVMGDADDPEGGAYVASYWAVMNGCKDTTVGTTPSPCMKYEGCPIDRPVTSCLIPGLGHAIWQNGVKEGWAFIKKL
jgi:polyhydroxybutyrate depolymerase